MARRRVVVTGIGALTPIGNTRQAYWDALVAGTSGAMVLDSSGNCGIGTTSPSSYNSIMNNLVIAGSADSGITIASGTSSEGSVAFADGTSGADEQ